MLTDTDSDPSVPLTGTLMMLEVDWLRVLSGTFAHGAETAS